MDLDKFLEKIPIDKVYEDLFQSGMQKAGEALATVVDAGNLILLPIKLLNERSRIYLKDNLRRYEEKLQKEKTKNIIAVPESIGLPIIDKLTYLNQKELSEAFINLLTKASFEETLNLVHPSFINILNNLSADEAKILFYLKDKSRIPSIDVDVNRSVENIKKPDHPEKGILLRSQVKERIEYTFQDREEVIIKAAYNLTGLEFLVNIDFSKNIDLYLENLELNKLIKFTRGYYYKGETSSYENLESVVYREQIEEIKGDIEEMEQQANNLYQLDISIDRGYIEFTEIGRYFVKACMNEVE